MRKTPTKVVEKGNNKLKSNVKTAAAILIAALTFAVATPKDANAQMFEGIDTKKMLAETDAEDKKLDNESAKLDNTIAGQNKVKAQNNKTIAFQDAANTQKRNTIAFQEVEKKTLDAEIARMKGEKGE